MVNLPTKDMDEFNLIIDDILQNETVQQMNLYRQHYDTSCFDHCYEVAYFSFRICKRFNLDYKSAARAGMLHDLFLYDWRKKQDGRKGLHAFRHPRVALNNSLKIFDLNKREQDIILKHMWPLTVIPPKYFEGYIISTMDKYCALRESFIHYSRFFTKRKNLGYDLVSSKK